MHIFHNTLPPPSRPSLQDYIQRWGLILVRLQEASSLVKFVHTKFMKLNFQTFNKSSQSWNQCQMYVQSSHVNIIFMQPVIFGVNQWEPVQEYHVNSYIHTY